MKTAVCTLLASLMLAAGASAQGLALINLNNSPSLGITNRVATCSPGHDYTGTFGLELWALNGGTIPSGVKLALASGPAKAAYIAIENNKFTKIASFANRTMTAGVFALGEVNVPIVNPAGGAVVLALVVWNSAASTYPAALDSSKTNLCSGVIAFVNPTSNPANQIPAPMSGWTGSVGDLVMQGCCASVDCSGFAAQSDPGGLLPGFDAVPLPRSFDNLSVGPVPTPFTFAFCGKTNNSVWINNDGTVTLDSAFGGRVPPNYVPSMALNSLHHYIFAPFWADVDTTRGGGTVAYGTNCACVASNATVTAIVWRPAFGITWTNVGYYKDGLDRRNSFQMLLIDRSDTGQGSFDLQYRYAAIQWDTADSALGRGGLCDLGAGFPARVGYAAGTNADCSLEVAGSGVCGALLDGGAFSLSFNSTNSTANGVYTWRFRNGVPAP